MKTLIIDDDPDIAESVGLCFEIRWPGSEIVRAGDGVSGLRMFQESDPDFVILDLGLPDIDGVEVCRQLRSTSDVGIMMLTVRKDMRDIIRGLESGADDYMTKPFDQMELLARVRSVLRRNLNEAKRESCYAAGRLSIDFEGREVRVDGNLVRLTPTEFNLLSHMARTPGRLVTHEDLLTRLWGIGYADATDYLKVHVMHLRRKLGDDAGNPEIIRTERSLGYKLVA